MTCEAFTTQFRKAIVGDGNAKRVTKIVCFALGDLNSKPPDWWRIQNEALPEKKRELETSIVDGALVHHAIALTMANIIRSCAKPSDRGIRLLTQDPGYCDKTKELIKDIGFEVVGGYGAGGFAEVDDETVVFSPFPKAPVKQIIADLARPLAFITLIGTTVWNPRRYLIPPPLLWFSLTCVLLGNHMPTQSLQGRSRCGRGMKGGIFQFHLIVNSWEVRCTSCRDLLESENRL